MEKSDLSTEIASETDQDLTENNQDLSEILERPHRTICGKFDECKYNWAKKFVV